MAIETCNRPNCNGTLEDGYCDVCGMAALPSLSPNLAAVVQSAGGASPTDSRSLSSTGSYSGSSAFSSRSGSTRRSTSTPRSSRKRLGAGLVSIPELPATDPEKLLLSDPQVPEHKRFCGHCNQALRRERGFCSQCGRKYSFVPSLKTGDVVAAQYEVKGAIAYGGLGWIYLGFDQLLTRYVVLKGLLNTEDESSAAIAVAERKFLASVKHSNIVGVYNFVNHDGEGFIIMEYVGGQTLKELRKQRGVLPVSEAIAYIHRILSAFAYLHSQGLVYCDFKPDNVMLEGDDVKLIDMGGVRRLDDLEGDIYGTVGYSAPEIAEDGPSIASDLFTVGRTLAVLITDIPGFGNAHQYTLPTPEAEPLFAQQESLYRFLLKATASQAEERFQSADEMADQLLGVLREIVARQTATPRPATSHLLEGDPLVLTVGSDFTPLTIQNHPVPLPLLDPTDPAFNALLPVLASSGWKQRSAALEALSQQFPTSVEVMLQQVNALIQLGATLRAAEVLQQAEAQTGWDWRVLWYQGKLHLAQGMPPAAFKDFDQVYADLPGELAVQLALGIAAEQSQQFSLASQFYDRVSGTDPNYISACFGLARCQFVQGNRAAAVAALARVPQNSNLYIRSQVETVRLLVKPPAQASGKPPQVQDLQQASQIMESLSLEGIEHHRLMQQIFEAALTLLPSSTPSPLPVKILGQPLQEASLRLGLEKSLRAMAHLATGEEKIRLVDQANRVRPRTFV